MPRVLQGGMGVGVSGWRLARAVSSQGHLGVVSGTASDIVLSRNLQLGDLDGHWRRAIAAFPLPDVAQRILDRFYIPGGKNADTPFLPYTAPTLNASAAVAELTVVANFAQIFLAKEGHSNPVGINLLEKIQLPTLMAIFGAMLAGVDYVNMGAGIPRQIPGVLDHFAEGQKAELRVDVVGQAKEHPASISFDPTDFMGKPNVRLKRPNFLPIVTSSVLADNLLRKATGRIDGFIVEAAIAGGHNAPPRGPLQLSEKGEPVYGPRDAVDPAKFRDLGKPFWLAGGYGRPGKLHEALAVGAAGIQVGTAFAFCEESELRPDLKSRILKESKEGKISVFTDPLASPTGFPFKVVQLAGTMSEAAVYEKRDRICDIGLLRHAYTKVDQSHGLRCAAEPEAAYIRKQGAPEDLACRKCLCNGLLSTIGLGQIRNGETEPPIITAGDDVADIYLFLEESRTSYSAADVLRKLEE